MNDLSGPKEFNYEIRQANTGDAAALLAYMAALTAETDIDIPLQPGEFHYTLEEEAAFLQKYASTDNCLFLVAEREGEIIGELTLNGGNLHAMHHTAILGMTVRRPWRGKGVGSALLASALNWARQNGILKRIELYVYARNQAAIHLYQKYGFEFEGRRYRSLTAITKAITGTHWNGRAFFGLRPPNGGERAR